MELKFPVVKLLDYRQHWPELEASPNPFGTVVMTHLKALETRRDAIERKAWKFRLTRRLYEQGYGREEILQLFRVIDWMLVLPEELEEGFRQEIEAYEEEKQMPYITSIERIGIQKGIQQGIEQGIERGLLQAKREDVLEVLKIRFQEVPGSMEEGINRVENPDTLKRLHRQAIVTESLEAFEQSLSP